MSQPQDDESRFVQLETKLMYQEKLLDDLNRVLVSHTTLIDELQLRLRRAEESLRAVPGEAKPPNEPPPHY